MPKKYNISICSYILIKLAYFNKIILFGEVKNKHSKSYNLTVKSTQKIV